MEVVITSPLHTFHTSVTKTQKQHDTFERNIIDRTFLKELSTRVTKHEFDGDLDLDE